MKPMPPLWVEDGPVTENILKGNEIDLLKFPAPKWHSKDGGRYIGTGSITTLLERALGSCHCHRAKGT